MCCLGATKIVNAVLVEARRNMTGEGEILAASYDKARGHLPFSVTFFISPHQNSPSPPLDIGGGDDADLPPR
jgi:hypothetical protein